MSTSRPLPWLHRQFHDSLRLCRVGYTALEIAVYHAASNWGGTSVDLDTFDRIVPHDDFQGPDYAGKLPFAHMAMALLFEVPVLEPTVVPTPMMSRNALAAWWEKFLRPESMSKETFAAGLKQPDFLISHGYRMLHQEYFDESESSPAFGACISMVGAGTVPILCSRPCKLCKFRRSAYASGSCDLCSMSKLIATSKQDNQPARRRRRMRVVKSLSDIGLNDNRPDDCESSSRAFASIVTAMDRQSAEYKVWSTNVHAALSSAPHVASQLSPIFSSSYQQEQLKELRRVIDPWEFDYAMWPKKIVEAQRWRDAEEAVVARRKVEGPTKSTLLKGELARALLERGFPRIEIAKQMGVSVSHLYHILNRSKAVAGTDPGKMIS